MKFGLTKEQFEFVQKNVMTPLSQKGANVFVYGSRARGDHKPFSDLDLMVETKNGEPIPLGAYLETMQKSNFPYKVDLVNYSDFAEAYKPSYQSDKLPWS